MNQLHQVKLSGHSSLGYLNLVNIHDFFKSEIVALPRVRDNEDFESYLSELIEQYIRTVKILDAGSHICARIRSAEGEIAQLGEWIRNAVRKYLAGTPEAAYKELRKGIRFVYPRLRKLFSRSIGGEQIGHLYRITKIPLPRPTEIPKERLFHVPFNLRYKVSRHRYGIPGFPCLYLGGSLELCKEELGLQNSDLSNVAVAEFGLRTKVKVLDFGSRPETWALQAMGNAKSGRDANPQVEQLIINYAICWPLIAASSIKVLHVGAPFVYEYIIPQMILQWIMGNVECDGIRYFSTRFAPDPDAIFGTANYVFPATQDSALPTGYSPKLKAAFELTDPVFWGPLPRKWRRLYNLRLEARAQEDKLHALARAPIP